MENNECLHAFGGINGERYAYFGCGLYITFVKCFIFLCAVLKM